VARHERSYDGERFTVIRTLKLTPSQAEMLDAAAAQQGVRWSDFARELLLRRLGTPAVVGGARRDPEAMAIIRALDGAAYESSAAGNNLNQLARHANTTGELGEARLAELDEAIELFCKAAEKHIAALDHVLGLIALGRAAGAEAAEPEAIAEAAA
jgi:hypothetical protein